MATLKPSGERRQDSRRISNSYHNKLVIRSGNRYHRGRSDKNEAMRKGGCCMDFCEMVALYMNDEQ